MTDTLGGSEPDPDFEAQFAQLVREVEEGRPAPVQEPSARARMLQNTWRDQPPPSRPWRGDVPTFGDATVEAQKAQKGGRGSAGNGRVWPRNLAIAVIVGALAYGLLETTFHRSGSTAANVPRTTSTQAAGTKASAAAARSADSAAHVAADALIPVAQLFPASVHGSNGTTYTLVQSGNLSNCITSDMVGPTLAGLFAQSKGCVGGEGALYKDAANDQFNVTVFTLKDPGDAVQILTDLSMNVTDFEVATLAPPAGSGLPQLSATSGIVQQFAGSGHRFGVFMAQWADGRTADYGALQSLLTPLQDVIDKTLATDS